MKTQTFKTNINCGSCLRGVTPKLDELSRACGLQWSVDLADPERTLTVQGHVLPEQVVQAVQAAGFKAEDKQAQHTQAQANDGHAH